MRRIVKNLGLVGVMFASACATTNYTPTATGDYLSARLAARKNEVNEAASAYTKALASAPDEASILRHAFFYSLAAGKIESSAPLAHGLINSDVGDADGLTKIALASIALKKNDFAAARAHLAGEFETPFLRSASYLIQVWVEQELNGPDAAIAMLQATPDGIFKGFHALHHAMLSEKAGDIETARKAYQESIFGLGGPVGRAAYGTFLERHGSKEAARDYYNLLHSQVGAVRRTADEGLARIENGKPSQKYANLTAAEGVAIALYSFGGAILEQTVTERNRAKEAGFNVGEPRYNMPLAMSQIAVYLDPELSQARSLVGQIFSAYGDVEQAERALVDIPPSSPLFEQSRIFIAGGVASRGQTDQAISMLKSAVAQDPQANQARFAIANLLAGDDRHSEAIDALSSIIDALDPTPDEDAWRYFVARATSFMALDQWDQAEVDLKRSVEIAPEEATTLNFLGYSWAERGINLDEAFELIEKAVALEPTSGAIKDSLGWAHYQRGDYEKAAPLLEEAASIEPADPTITDHLGDLYWKMNRPIEARYQWQHVLELDGDDALKVNVAEKLKNGLDKD